MHEQEILNMLTLSRISYFNSAEITALWRKAGSATAIMDNRRNICDLMPDCNRRTADALADTAEAEARAESEIEFAARNGIEILCMDSEGYPQRLQECDDAPLVLFYKGTARLNRMRVINIVGTRHCTAYGQDCIHSFVKELAGLCPDVLIVSGLAYGVDICAHREALSNGLDTVAVLAHGLDYLYPPRHRDTADRMLTQGGLLTEFFSNTNADKLNFLRRNRIVAGISDATVLIESAAHGGGLVTARIANSYSRDVFAFPGRTGDMYSEGCNNLIRDNKAGLICSAADFINAMGWQTDARLEQARRKGIERTLFPELTPDEQAVADALQKENDQQINSLTLTSGIPVSRLAATLFTLEMKGMVRCMAGGVYHLINN